MSASSTSYRILPDNWLDPLPLEQWFDPAKPVEVDLGCGKGRFLLARAARFPGVQFLGIDRMLKRIRKIDNRLLRSPLENVRLLRMEGYYAVTYLLPPRSIDTCYIFFPDPWPKKRHHRNRIMNERFMEALIKAMKPGGHIHFATDHLPYFDEVQLQLAHQPALKPTEVFVPTEEERTDFELWYLDKKPIGRASYQIAVQK
ncbi:MAG TPA: tRNA (guanosine(46)-N7)-methyltransferase TrmB [Kiritimatiellia bacterium]|nr:tRNA (guanosine(46)-N7)-methyltransferase TrmB [Kiritimatiellia bacterium]